LNNGKEKSISIWKFRQTIKRLPEDEPREYPNKPFHTQKEHWLGWLFSFFIPGAGYDRQIKHHDARFVYNHIVEPLMLLYLIRTIPLRAELVETAEKAYAQGGETMMAQSGAIRKVVPWSEIYQALWENEEEKLSFLEQFRSRLGARKKWMR
jgi:hypothetical protein